LLKYLIPAILLFASTLVLLHAGEEAKDLERLQGTWVIVSLVEEGKAVPAADTDLLEITIDKDVFTVKEKGKTVLQHKIKLDPTAKPKQIDFTYLDGEDKGKTEPGIYVFEKDQVKLALDEKKKGRPTVFEGDGAASYSIMVIKKKPAKD
jgi:uncharacterized protein (TIGR03067 family)